MICFWLRCLFNDGYLKHFLLIDDVFEGVFDRLLPLLSLLVLGDDPGDGCDVLEELELPLIESLGLLSETLSDGCQQRGQMPIHLRVFLFAVLVLKREVCYHQQVK